MERKTNYSQTFQNVWEKMLHKDKSRKFWEALIQN